MDEVRELDLHLDDAAEYWQNEHWGAWQRWTLAWVVLVSLAWTGAVVLVGLIVTGDPIRNVLVVEAALLVLLAATTVMGWRARRRWARVYRLRHGEGP